MVEGKIFAFESMGLVDGPGIRSVVFFSGCSLRCRYCHNPESWNMNAGKTVSPDGLMRKLVRFRPYFEKSGGGVTFSGGEPLLQPEFLAEMLSLCKKEGIHTCIDTAGAGAGDYERILGLADLVLLDVKAAGAEKYRGLCGGDISEPERFMAALAKSGKPAVVRRVVIPGINDSERDMEELKAYISEKIPTAKAVELLPYHKSGEHKYKKLGLVPALADIPQMSGEKTQELWNKYFSGR